MDFNIYYHAFTERNPEAEEAALRHREEIRRKLTEALLASHVNMRCASVPAMHPVDRILNRKRKPHAQRAEIIEVVARRVE